MTAIRGHRFVNVVGPGGTGKTRLALEVAHALSAEFSGGVCFVDLSAVTDDAVVDLEVASSLGMAKLTTREY